MFSWLRKSKKIQKTTINYLVLKKPSPYRIFSWLLRYCRKILKKPKVGRIKQKNANINPIYLCKVKMTPSSINASVTQKIEKNSKKQLQILWSLKTLVLPYYFNCCFIVEKNSKMTPSSIHTFVTRKIGKNAKKQLQNLLSL